MRDIDKWKPSKFVYRNNRLTGSRNPAHLDIASRLVADIVASYYEKYLRLYAKGNLIDLGCGNVPLFAAYRDYVEQNVCIDWNSSIHPNNFLDIACDLNKPLPFDDQQFDTILLSDVLEHIQDPALLWHEMQRILKVDGNLVLNVPFFYKIHEAPSDYYRYTEFALERFARQNGLSILVLVPIGGLPEILADLTAKAFKKAPLFGTFMTILIQQLCKWFINTSAGKKISKKTAERFPLGYFLVAQKKQAAGDAS